MHVGTRIDWEHIYIWLTIEYYKTNDVVMLTWMHCFKYMQYQSSSLLRYLGTFSLKSYKMFCGIHNFIMFSKVSVQTDFKSNQTSFPETTKHHGMTLHWGGIPSMSIPKYASTIDEHLGWEICTEICLSQYPYSMLTQFGVQRCICWYSVDDLWLYPMYVTSLIH